MKVPFTLKGLGKKSKPIAKVHMVFPLSVLFLLGEVSEAREGSLPTGLMSCF